jgi:hypothetical protein
MLLLQCIWIVLIFGVFLFFIADGGALTFFLTLATWALLKWAGVFRVAANDQARADD